MIVRSPRPERGYLTISNDLARDERLSYRARGVLVAILSRPDNWQTSATQLAIEGKEGRDAIRSALNELEAAGYVERIRTQDGRGQWHTTTVVADVPREKTVADSQSPTPENPSSVPLGETVSPLVAPETDSQASVSQALKEEPKKKNQELSSASADQSAETTDGSASVVSAFDRFWAAYPRTRDVSKKVARQKFTIAARTTPADWIVRAAGRFAEICAAEGKQEQFIPHPATWLNQERYKIDILQPDYEPEPAAAPKGWW